MIPFQWPNFYSYRQYESHSFMRKCRSMELLWKMQLPFDWTFQVNVFTYSTLNATLRASLQSRTFGRSNLLLFFLVFVWACLSTSNPLWRQQDGTSVPMGMGGLCMSSSLNFVLNFHDSCGFLDYLCNCSCLQLDKPMASSSSMYISYHFCTLPYFISLSDTERGVKCKIMETKTIEAIKVLSSSMQWYCFVHRQPLQHKGSEVGSHWKETDSFCMARAPGILLGRLLVLMPWVLEENCWDLLVLPPSWASTASSSLGGLSSNGGLVLLLWSDPAVNWAH